MALHTQMIKKHNNKLPHLTLIQTKLKTKRCRYVFNNVSISLFLLLLTTSTSIVTVNSFIIPTKKAAVAVCNVNNKKPYYHDANDDDSMLLHAEQQKESNSRPSSSMLTSIIAKTTLINTNKSSSSSNKKHKLLLSALRKTATIKASSSSTSTSTSTDIKEQTNANHNDLKKDLSSSSVIHSTIQSFMHKQQNNNNKDDEQEVEYTMGLFGERIPMLPNNKPKESNKPIAILINPNVSKPKIQIKDLFKVRTCNKKDDIFVANLRLSVFLKNAQNAHNNSKYNYFQKRSCDIINNRRTLFDSVCLVVTISKNYYNILRSNSLNSIHNNGSIKQYVNKRLLDTDNDDDSDDLIIGSLECSYHEFEGTLLGASQPKGALMYVTEVAVSPYTRRCGIGTKLLQGMEELAKKQKIKTIYLHAEITNSNALHMYAKFGFTTVLDSFSSVKDTNYGIYKEFSQRLNLYNDKNTIGNNKNGNGGGDVKYYYLMNKHLCYDNHDDVDVDDEYKYYEKKYDYIYNNNNNNNGMIIIDHEATLNNNNDSSSAPIRNDYCYDNVE